MALRTLGSSLVAKASPGAKLRDIQEQQVQQPEIPGKGVPGTISRQGSEEPLERPVPAGSEKITAVQPIIESSPIGLPTDINATPGTPEAGGLFGEVVPPGQTPPLRSAEAPSAGVPAASPLLANIAPSPAPSQAPAGTRGPGGTPTVASRPGQVESAFTKNIAPSAPGRQTGAQVEKQAKPSTQQAPSQYQPVSLVGGKVIAGEPGQKPRPVTTGQQIAGSVGKVLSNIPQLRSLGNQLQSFGGQIAQGDIRGTLSPRPAGASLVQSLTNQLRSAVQNAFSGLRSLFGGR